MLVWMLLKGSVGIIYEASVVDRPCPTEEKFYEAIDYDNIPMGVPWLHDWTKNPNLILGIVKYGRSKKEEKQDLSVMFPMPTVEP